MSDELKAITEVSKTAGKAIDASTKAGSFLNKVFGEACVEGGGILTDKVKAYRYKNWLKIQDNIQEIHKQRGVEGKLIPIKPSIGIPLLDAASLEDEPALQDLWAQLIANYTDPTKTVERRSAYITILKDLAPLDVKVLNYLSSKIKNTSAEIISKNLSEYCDSIDLALCNLMRLQLVDISNRLYMDDNMSPNSISETSTYAISILGKELVRVCEK